MPPPLEPLGLGSVRDHLNPEAPNFKQEDVTAQQWENISKIEQTLTGAISKGKLKAGSIVVAAADRADGKVFKQNWGYLSKLFRNYAFIVDVLQHFPMTRTAHGSRMDFR